MKPALLFSGYIISLSLAAALVASCSFFSGKENQNPTYQLSHEEYELLQPGDIILRQGFGVGSQAISEFLNENIKVSHVALLSQNAQSHWQVIQSVSQNVSDFDGMQAQYLSEFIRESQTNSLVVVRFKGFNANPGLNHRFEQAVLSYLKQQVPFDHSSSLTDSTQFFCSELIWRLFLNEAGVDIFEKMNKDDRRERLRFASFFDPDHFEVIINHHSRDQ